MRPIAIGSKNLAVCGLVAGRPARGSHHEPDPVGQAQWAPPTRHLRDVLQRLPMHKASQIGELLPHRWMPAAT